MIPIRVVAPLAIALLAACDDSSGAVVCTEEFHVLPVHVHDTLGGPVAGATVYDSFPRTGQVFVPGPLPSLPAGTYDAIDDGALPMIRSSGDTVFVFGSKGQSKFGLLWVVDVPGGCHVHKRFGADSILLP